MFDPSEIQFSRQELAELGIDQQFEDYSPTMVDIAGEVADIAEEKELPVVLLGGAGDDDSPAAEMAECLRMVGQRFLHTNHLECLVRAVYYIAAEDQRYVSYRFARGSVVIDPFDTIPDQPGVTKL